MAVEGFHRFLFWFGFFKHIFKLCLEVPWKWVVWLMANTCESGWWLGVFQLKPNHFLKDVNHDDHKCMESISNVQFSQVILDLGNVRFQVTNFKHLKIA